MSLNQLVKAIRLIVGANNPMMISGMTFDKELAPAKTFRPILPKSATKPDAKPFTLANGRRKVNGMKRPHEQTLDEALENLLSKILDQWKTEPPSKYSWYQNIRPLAQQVRSERKRLNA